MTDPTPDLWLIELHIPGFSQDIAINLGEAPVVIGRSRSSEDYPNSIDLSDFNAVEKGVSRHHVELSADDTRLMVRDLNAANGTFINDQRLSPDTIYELQHDDTLSLGAFQMLVRVVKRPQPPEPEDKLAQTDNLRDQTVLIVEDHPEVAQLFSMMLQRQGYATHISRDATRAMHFLRDNQPYAVILDLMLPGTPGLEVARYMRRDSRMDKIPIIVVTARKTDQARAEAIEAGADVYLEKPINAGELGGIVSEYIGRKRFATSPLQLPPDMDRTKKLDKKQTSRLLASNSGSQDSVAIIVANYPDKPFTVRVQRATTFGRSDNNRALSHVNLSEFKAANLGVSRVHMVMTHRGGKFFIEDSGSMNGTYINGRQLKPHHPMEVHTGSEVRLGQLTLFMYFLESDTDTKRLNEKPFTIWD